MSSLQKLVLVGGAGTSSDVLALISSINAIHPRYNVLGLLDDSLPAGSDHFGIPVLGGLDSGAAYQDAKLVDCLGSTSSYRHREAILERHALLDMPFETIIHPSAVIAYDAIIGEGCVLYPNVVVLSHVRIGQHVTILSGSVINHDVDVGDWSILGSGVMLSGAVSVGTTCYLGTASSIREEITIGPGSLIGMGSAVISDVAANMVVAGVPARVLRPAE